MYLKNEQLTIHYTTNISEISVTIYTKYQIFEKNVFGLSLQNQNCFYCQVGFHIQGMFSGVFGANLNIENIGKVEKTYLE